MQAGYDISEMLAGIGIFLLGMNFLEDTLKSLAGRPFKLFLRKQTTNNSDREIIYSLNLNLKNKSEDARINVNRFATMTGTSLMMIP
jgi:hypothetical protein